MHVVKIYSFQFYALSIYLCTVFTCRSILGNAYIKRKKTCKKNLHKNMHLIVVTHRQETCTSFLEQVDLPEILLNIAQLLPATCRKTCASRCYPRTCPNRAVFYLGKKTCASFLAHDARKSLIGYYILKKLFRLIRK